MAKLTRSESAQLLSLMDKPGWEVLIKLVAMTINELNSRPCPGENEFQLMRSVFRKEARVEALQEFFKGIEEGTSLTVDRQ